MRQFRQGSARVATHCHGTVYPPEKSPTCWLINRQTRGVEHEGLGGQSPGTISCSGICRSAHAGAYGSTDVAPPTESRRKGQYQQLSSHFCRVGIRSSLEASFLRHFVSRLARAATYAVHVSALVSARRRAKISIDVESEHVVLSCMVAADDLASACLSDGAYFVVHQTRGRREPSRESSGGDGVHGQDCLELLASCNDASYADREA